MRVGSGVQTDATTPNKFGTGSASWEDYNPQVFVIYTLYVMSVRGPNNVGRAVQTDPTLLRHASAIMEQKMLGVVG